MDIKQFELQLNDACSKHHAWASESVQTEVVTVEALMEEFSQIPTIAKSEDRVRRLFKLDYFIEVLREDADRYKLMTPEQLDSICCKLDVGLIGLLWCKGDLEDKANFLFNLVRHPPKRDAEGRYIDAKKHPSEFFKAATPRQGADLELDASVQAEDEAKVGQEPARGFFANLFGGFSAAALIEEVELANASILAPSSGGTQAIQNNADDEIIWTNKNLKYVFKRLFEFSIDVPASAWLEFSDLEMVDIADYRTDAKMKAPLSQIKMQQFQQYNQYGEYNCGYEHLYETWLVQQVFGEANSRLTRAQWKERFETNKKLGFCFNSFEIRGKFKRFSAEYAKKMKQEERERHGISSATSQSVLEDGRTLKEKVEDWIWYDEQETFEKSISLSLITALKNERGLELMDNFPPFLRVLRSGYFLVMLLGVHLAVSDPDVDKRYELSYHLVFLSTLTFLLGAFCASDDADLHEKERAKQPDDEDEFQISFTMEGEDDDPKYNSFAPWKWYLILYHLCFLTAVSTSIILIVTEVFEEAWQEFAGPMKLLKNVKLNDFALTLVPLLLFTVDNAFTCTPLTNRHLLFVLLIQGAYAVFVHAVCPDVYGFLLYPEAVMVLSIAVHVLAHNLMMAKLKWLGYPFNKIVEAIQANLAQQLAEDNKVLLRRGTLAPNPNDIKLLLAKTHAGEPDKETGRTDNKAVSAASPSQGQSATLFSPTSGKARAPEMDFK